VSAPDDARACAEAIIDAVRLGDADEESVAKAIREHTAREVAAALAEQAGEIGRLKAAIRTYVEGARNGERVEPRQFRFDLNPLEAALGAASGREEPGLSGG
jgi:hypothetical protein